MHRSASVLFLSLALSVAPQESVRLDRIEEASDGGALPPGWSLRAVAGQRLPDVRVEEVEGALALVLVADSAAGQAWLELDEPLDPTAGALSWKWSISARPRGASLRIPEMDDSPARFFVVFGGGGLFRRPRVLFYSWGQDEVVDDAFLSHVTDRFGVVVIRNAADSTGAWYTERRDPEADFHRVFGRDPDEIRALGLMVDTDQMGGRAEVWLHNVRWETAPQGR